MRPFFNTSVCRKYTYVVCICYTSTVMRPKTGLWHVTRFDIMWHNIAQDIIKVMHIDNGMSFNVQFHSSTDSFIFIHLADVFIRSDLRPETFMDKKKPNMYSEYPKQKYASINSVCCLKYYIGTGYKVLTNQKIKLTATFCLTRSEQKECEIYIKTSKWFLHVHIWLNLDI